MKFSFMKNLKLTTIAEVPSNLQGMYVKTSAEGEEDAFEIPENLLEIAKAYDGFNGVNTKLRNEVTKLKSDNGALTDWSTLGETPDAVQSRIQELMDEVAKGTDGAVNWEKAKTELQAIHAKELEKREGVNLAMRSTLEQHLVDSVAVKSIADEKGSVSLLLPHIKTRTKVVQGEDGVFRTRVVDEAGDLRIGNTGEAMTIAELVNEMKSDVEFGRAFDSEKKGGSGAPPAPRGNRPMAAADLSPLDKLKVGLKGT